jgi:hypothetical protein
VKELCLTIPCEPGKPDLVRPIHVSAIVNGYADSRWKCMFCGMQFHRASKARSHMGMIMNKPHSCTVLQAQDSARRLR